MLRLPGQFRNPVISVTIGLGSSRMLSYDRRPIPQTLDDIADGFDAAVGRLILMYLSDPAAALRRAAGLVRPVV